jgi:hypothetical protein
MSDASIDRVHHDLKIIASLRVNDKIYVQDGVLCVLSPSVYGAVWRWARGDGRVKSLQTMDNSMTEALTIAEFFMDKVGRSENDTLHQWRRSNDETCRSTVKRLHQELRAAVLGLRHLLITYNGDNSTSARICVLRDKTSDRLHILEKWLKRFGNARDEDSTTSSFGVMETAACVFVNLEEEDLNKRIMLSEEAMCS